MARALPRTSPFRTVFANCTFSSLTLHHGVCHFHVDSELFDPVLLPCIFNVKHKRVKKIRIKLSNRKRRNLKT